MTHTPGPWEWLREAPLEGDDLGGLCGSDNTLVISVGTDFGDSPEMYVRLEDRPLLKSATDMLAMLEELEWSGTGISFNLTYSACPLCRGVKAGTLGLDCYGHAPDCRLAALLKRAKGEA